MVRFLSHLKITWIFQSEIGEHACPRLVRVRDFKKNHVRVRGLKNFHVPVRVRVRNLKKFHVCVRVCDFPWP